MMMITMVVIMMMMMMIMMNRLYDRRQSVRQKDVRKTMNKKHRVVKKEGSTNVSYTNISKRRRRYFSDLYTTLLDAPWSYCLLIFGSTFYFSWLLFALLYWVIAYR